jgi:hypothetical protein
MIQTIMNVTIDLDALRKQLDENDADVARLLAEAESKRAIARDLRDLITIAERLYGLPPSEPTAAPTTSNGSTPPFGMSNDEAVLSVLRSGGVWDTTEMIRELRRRGWVSHAESPVAVISGSFSRLRKTRPDEVIRVSFGKYAYKPIDPGEGKP